MRTIRIEGECKTNFPAVANETIKIARTTYTVLSVFPSPVGITLIDLQQTSGKNAGTIYTARWSDDHQFFLAVTKKAKDDGPTGLQAMFTINPNR
jgi:hypothetical protein